MNSPLFYHFIFILLFHLCFKAFEHAGIYALLNSKTQEELAITRNNLLFVIQVRKIGYYLFSALTIMISIMVYA